MAKKGQLLRSEELCTMFMVTVAEWKTWCPKMIRDRIKKMEKLVKAGVETTNERSARMKIDQMKLWLGKERLKLEKKAKKQTP